MIKSEKVSEYFVQYYSGFSCFSYLHILVFLHLHYLLSLIFHVVSGLYKGVMDSFFSNTATLNMLSLQRQP